MTKYSDYMEITRDISHARSSLENLATKESGSQTRADWENFLKAWQAAVDKLQDYAAGDTSTKILGEAIRSMNQTGDPALTYCRVARNAVAHRLTPAVKMVGSATHLAGGVTLSGGSIKIGKFYSGGELIGEEVEVETDEGTPLRVKGMKNPAHVQHTYESVELPEFVTERKGKQSNGKQHYRPTQLNGKVLDRADFYALGEYALKWLEDNLAQVQRLL